jgi:hypothetical protein
LIGQVQERLVGINEQKHPATELLPQRLKPVILIDLFGTAEAVPFRKTIFEIASRFSQWGQLLSTAMSRWVCSKMRASSSSARLRLAVRQRITNLSML